MIIQIKKCRWADSDAGGGPWQAQGRRLQVRILATGAALKGENSVGGGWKRAEKKKSRPIKGRHVTMSRR
jgi:hypothetical protein